VDGGKDCWIVIACANYKILVPRPIALPSPRLFSTSSRPLHNAKAKPRGITGLTRMRGRMRRDQLTCRRGAPKTRHQFGCPAWERGLQGEFQWAMSSFAMP
jgi:hypothetical protein